MDAALKNIDKLTDSRFPLVHLDTHQVDHVIELFQRFTRINGKAIYLWAEDDGLVRLDAGHIMIPRTQRVDHLLNYIHATKHYGVYLLRGFGSHLQKDSVIAQLKRIVSDAKTIPKMVILLGEDISIPSELRPATVTVKHVSPPRDEREKVNQKVS